MSITNIPTAAALRSRTLSTLGSPFTMSTVVPSWREQVPANGVPAGMRDTSLQNATVTSAHNSIPAALRTAAVPAAVQTANVGIDVYGATKQAAPPRGVPR